MADERNSMNIYAIENGNHDYLVVAFDAEQALIAFRELLTDVRPVADAVRYVGPVSIDFNWLGESDSVKLSIIKKQQQGATDGG